SVLFGIFIPIAGKLAEKFGRREVLIATTILIGIFSFFLPGLMTSGETAIFVFVILAMALMGMTYGLIGTALAAPFPTQVRYTGSSITFNFAGIFGASLAPYIATWLQANYGMTFVGYYLGIAAAITLVCILLSGKDEV
ncbi:MAG: MFS transporter, partial [Shinella sp.]